MCSKIQSRQTGVKGYGGFKSVLLPPALLMSGLLLFSGLLLGDDLLRVSGRSLKPAQERYIRERVKSLRESDHAKRFENVRSLIGLDTLAVPFLAEEARHGSNPIPVRCALLTLSEIAAQETFGIIIDIVKNDRKGRDERAIAALGLGKLGTLAEASNLKKMLRRGEERLLRKTAALALARMGDESSTPVILSLLKQERDDRVAVTLLVAGAMAGGKEYTTVIPNLIKGMKPRRRRAAVLGAAFRSDPVLLACLLKYGVRDEETHRNLAVCLGRYQGEHVESLLSETARGQDETAALDALYSLASAAGEGSVPVLAEILSAPRFSAERRCHALLAAADVGLAGAFLEKSREALSHSSSLVRSSAALAIAAFQDHGAVPLLRKTLSNENEKETLRDLIMVIGLLGSEQDRGVLAKWLKPDADPDLKTMAGIAGKVLGKKMERALLEGEYEKRISSLSGRWSYRFRSAFLDEVRYGLELDSILRREPGDTGQSREPADSPGGEGGSEETGGDDPASGEEEGAGGEENNSKRRLLVRGEVVEWDILHWFEDLGYFPDLFFRGRQ